MRINHGRKYLTPEEKREENRLWREKNPDYNKYYSKHKRSPLGTKGKKILDISLKNKMIDCGLITTMSDSSIIREAIEDRKMLDDMPKVFAWDEISVMY